MSRDKLRSEAAYFLLRSFTFQVDIKKKCLIDFKRNSCCSSSSRFCQCDSMRPHRHLLVDWSVTSKWSTWWAHRKTCASRGIEFVRYYIPFVGINIAVAFLKLFLHLKKFINKKYIVVYRSFQKMLIEVCPQMK